MKIGPYSVQKRLGSMVVEVDEEEVLQFAYMHAGGPDIDAAPPRASYYPSSVTVLDLGVSAISLADLVRADKKFSVAADVKALMKKGFDFQRVTLVANFRPGNGLKFSSGSIDVILENRDCKATVHSIAPLSVAERSKVNKKFGLSPEVKLFDVGLNPGLSYTDEREYQKVHPLITGYFAMKDYANWKFETNDIVDKLQGTQIVEFIVKQKKGTRSVWSAAPMGDLVTDGNGIVRIARWMTGNGRKKTAEAQPEKFTLPLTS
jgi:hypothetical protein